MSLKFTHYSMSPQHVFDWGRKSLMITSPHTKTHSISQMICYYDRCVCAVTFKWGNILLSAPHHCGDMTSVSLSQKVSADPRLLFCSRDWESSVLQFEWCEKYPVATENSLKPGYKFLFLCYHITHFRKMALLRETFGLCCTIRDVTLG